VPFNVLGEQFIVNCAFGLTLVPSKDLEASSILHQSFKALKVAVLEQEYNIQFFDNSLSKLIN